MNQFLTPNNNLSPALIPAQALLLVRTKRKPVFLCPRQPPSGGGMGGSGLFGKEWRVREEWVFFCEEWFFSGSSSLGQEGG